MYNSLAIEERGTPAVALVNEGFLNDARSAASQRGMPGARIIPEKVPCECTLMTKTEAGVNDAMEAIIAGLTRPLTEEERSPKKKPEKQTRIAFKGNLDEVNRFFYESGWADGLPVVPPTEEKVAEMLAGTDLPPDSIVARIIPRLGRATVEKIAVNAVMAGALPTYMPLLIAGVQAIMNPDAGFHIFEVSTGSWSPFWVINGPVRQALNVNAGTGVLSPGDIANAVFGRAMGLIIKNIGGARKGIEDMGVFGNPGKYSMVVAENEEGSPWEPLHVERGFKKEDSTVTVFFPNSFLQVPLFSTDAAGILSSVTCSIPPRSELVLPKGRLLGLLLNPTNAGILAEEKWTKADVKNIIASHAGGMPVLTRPVSFAPTEGSRGQFNSPDDIMVVVTGGPGVFNGLTFGVSMLNNTFVTQKVTLPKQWGCLVEKYQGMVPGYVLY